MATNNLDLIKNLLVACDQSYSTSKQVGWVSVA